MKISKATVDKLFGIYKACGGVMSEYDAFDGFYKGGGEKLMKDLEEVLTALGVKFVEPEYKVISYFDHTTEKEKWAIIDNPQDPMSYVLTGMNSKQEAEQMLKEVIGCNDKAA